MAASLPAALALLLAAAGGAPPARGVAGVASSLEKLRPSDPLPPGRAIALAAARGECEAAQVAVRTPQGLRALSAEAAPLRGRGAARLPVALYRVATVPLARPSGPDGEAGEWPDPLVPVRDRTSARRAAPSRWRSRPAGCRPSGWSCACPGRRRRAATAEGSCSARRGGRWPRCR
ncbi:MAG: hypothetical protein QM767_06940 [Anaeromyxobacter sp.]